jgi:glycine/D-amino acid oxidase-like deaminating enzyme
MKQAANGTVLIGGAWTAETAANGQPQVLPDSIEGNLWVARRTIPALAGLSLVRSWAAMNIDIDGAPLLSTLPGHPRVAVAATANGFTLGPLMGEEAAALALTGRASADLGPFTLDRF